MGCLLSRTYSEPLFIANSPQFCHLVYLHQTFRGRISLKYIEGSRFPTPPLSLFIHTQLSQYARLHINQIVLYVRARPPAHNYNRKLLTTAVHVVEA